MYHHDKRHAQVLIGHALESRGWKIFGYKEDRSDLQTDYWDPESWDGIATFGEYIACVGVGAYEVSRSGKPIEKYVPQEGGTCERCKGSGEDPLGYTLDSARADPRKYHIDRLLAEHPGGTLVEGKLGPGVKIDETSTVYAGMLGVVSPIPFNGNGKMHCITCHGAGKLAAKPKVEVIDHYPVFQANPKGTNWHLERNGKILAKGIGFNTVLKALGNSNKIEDKVVAGDVLASKIHAAMEADSKRKGTTPRKEAPMKQENAAVIEAHAFTVRKGTREGFVEILFAVKPDQDTIQELKGAGFRFSFGGGEARWYGKADALPARYRSADMAERPADPEPPAPEEPNAGASETDEPEPETDEGEGETKAADAETANPKDASLLPIDTLRCNPHVFEGHVGATDSAYIVSGHLGMVRKFVKTKFKEKHALSKHDGGRYSNERNPLPEASIKVVFDTAERGTEFEATFLGYTSPANLYSEDCKSEHVGVLRDQGDHIAFVDALKYKLFVKHLDFDTVKIDGKGEKPVTFHKNGKMAGVLMPLHKEGMDKRKALKFLKAVAAQSATPPAAKPSIESKVEVIHVNEETMKPAPAKVTPLPLPVSASLALIKAALGRLKVKA